MSFSVSTQELREKLLDFLSRKQGEHSTKDICVYANTWAGNTKIRETLDALAEEGLVLSRRTTYRGKGTLLWSTPIPVTTVDDDVQVPINPNKDLIAEEYLHTLSKLQRRQKRLNEILNNTNTLVAHFEGLLKCL